MGKIIELNQQAKMVNARDTANALNEQMKMLNVSSEALDRIHESILKIAEYQQKHAHLLIELGNLLGLTSVEEKDLV